jgi:hypothetical protein
MVIWPIARVCIPLYRMGEEHMNLELFYVWLTTTCIALRLGFAGGFDVGIKQP